MAIINREKFGLVTKNIVRDTLSWPIFQPIFEIILNFSLKALNIGEGHDVKTSGEKSVFPILYKICRDTEATIFDVGAHTGEWFRAFSKNYRGKYIVYSFEPSTASYKELSQIRIHGFCPVNLALGDKTEQIYLSYNKADDTTAHVSDAPNTSGQSEKISVITLDKYCSDNKIKHIHLLKLDVEGYELKVLAGAQEMIHTNNIDLIQFEFGAESEEKYSLKDFFNVLEEKYQICRILKHGCQPLKKYNHYYEIMTCTNFVAIRRELL